MVIDFSSHSILIVLRYYLKFHLWNKEFIDVLIRENE